MGQLIKHSFNQQLMYPDELAYELNLIPTPEKFHNKVKTNMFCMV